MFWGKDTCYNLPGVLELMLWWSIILTPFLNVKSFLHWKLKKQVYGIRIWLFLDSTKWWHKVSSKSRASEGDGLVYSMRWSTELFSGWWALSLWENVAFFLWSQEQKTPTFNLIRRNVLFWFWNVEHLVVHSNLEKLLQSRNVRIYLKVCRAGFNMFLKIRVYIKVSPSLGRSEL